jgi:hypothetical protein
MLKTTYCIYIHSETARRGDVATTILRISAVFCSLILPLWCPISRGGAVHSWNLAICRIFRQQSGSDVLVIDLGSLKSEEMCR